MFQKILIANRGEIACRIIETCRKMNIEAAVIYSDADRNARHVRLADEAHYVGAAKPSESYLSIPRILAAAKDARAEAIHPGYGFLSENAGFARACAQHGIRFIGPTPESIEVMGLKAEAKQRMLKAGVPVVPGYNDAAQDDNILIREAKGIGYPLLIKASAGGGGRGMRIVESAKDLQAALLSARREAMATFGNDALILERYIPNARHIEVQILADAAGNTLHLFERDCSIQRRYQKVVEESPAPLLSNAIRNRMLNAAIAAARAVRYENAGTVEFILGDSNEFFFMEMNTRLQVEHPVTEMITGIDLVEWQLRIAAGQSLSFTQEDVQENGHAIELRVYAEDPHNEFLPQAGSLSALHWPKTNANVRVDTGYDEGDEISGDYDSMIAKLIVHDENRERALYRLRHSLRDTSVIGLRANLPLLRKITNAPVFLDGKATTAFLDQHLKSYQATPTPDWAFVAACMIFLGARQPDNASQTETYDGDFSDAPSPWVTGDGWRLAGQSKRKLRLRPGAGEDRLVVAKRNRDDWTLEMDGHNHSIRASFREATLRLTFDNRTRSIRYFQSGDILELLCEEDDFFVRKIPLFDVNTEQSHSDQIHIAPMPGRVVTLHVDKGDTVTAGQSLLVMEGMKIEYTVSAQLTGKVTELHCHLGERIDADVPLVKIEPAAE